MSDMPPRPRPVKHGRRPKGEVERRVWAAMDDVVRYGERLSGTLPPRPPRPPKAVRPVPPKPEG